MELTNFFVLMAGALVMRGGIGATISVPLSLTKQTAEPAVKQKAEELRRTTKKDWYCSWEGKWQCTPVFEVEAATLDELE